jgi:hypothetical protein
MGVGNKDRFVGLRISEDTYRELQKKDKNVSRVIRGMIANELIKERGDYLKAEDRRIKNDSAVFVKFCCTQAGITEEQFYEELQKLIWDDKVVFENGKIILKSDS